MAHTSRVWFLLFDTSTGKLCKKTSVTSVRLPPGSDVADFRHAVKAEWSDTLSSFAPSALVVYKNEAAFKKRNAAVADGKEEPLKSCHSLDGLGASLKEALVVVVPSSWESAFVKEVDLSEKLTGLSLDSKIIRLEPEVLQYSGIWAGTGKYLYNREAVFRQMKFLEVSLMNEQCQLAWISGAPGVGKSATTLAYVSQLACQGDWVVSWISSSVIIWLFRLSGNNKTYYIVESGKSLCKWLEEVNDRHHLCVLDGDYTENDVLPEALGWLDRKTSNFRRFLVIVPSEGSPTRYPEKLLRGYGIAHHRVPSWTLEQFVKMLDHDYVWNSVKKHFYEDEDEVEELDTLERKRELIERKFYFAGGSARYMLDDSIECVKTAYRDAIIYVPDLEALLKRRRLGILKSDWIHCIYSLDEQGKWSFVSKYVVKRLTTDMDVRMIDSAVDACKGDMSPEAIASMFEMRCHYVLRHGDFEFEVNGEKEIWKWGPVYDYNTKNPDIDRFKEGARFALKPHRVQQGSYDLIFVEFVGKDERTGQLIFKFDFILFTMFSKHSLYIHLLEAALTKIRNADTDNKIQMLVDITCVSPKSREVAICDRRGDPRTIGWERFEPRRAEVSLPFYWY